VTVKDIRPALRALLLADTAISAAVGGSRIYPVLLPQGQRLPSIVYHRVSGIGDHHMQGPSGLNQPRIQIDCWAQSQDAAVSLADLVKSKLDGFAGTVLWGSSSPQNETVIQGAFYDTEFEDYDDVAKLYRVSRDYLVWYEEL